MRGAFTLVEVAIALGLLGFCLSAITTSYLTGLRWTAETRHQYSATLLARQVLDNPTLLHETPALRRCATRKPFSDSSRGWLNGYFCVRTVLAQRPLANAAGLLQEVQVVVYAGGDDRSGQRVRTLINHVIAR